MSFSIHNILLLCWCFIVTVVSFVAYLQNAIAQDLIIAHAVGAFPAGIPGVSFDGVDGSILHAGYDLRPGGGNLLGPYWEVDSLSLGESWTLNTGESPRDVKESFLSQILEEHPPRKYYLSRKACLGILRRSAERGKGLPAKLKEALEIQAGIK